jgi:hypothetical protein
MTFGVWSPDLISSDFFLWGCVKDAVFMPPLLTDIRELQRRITETMAYFSKDILEKVWEEMEYRIDVCCVTHGAHIECL